MPWLKTSAFHKDLASGVLHRFLLPNGLLLFSAFFQMFTYGIATTGNQTSAASVQLTLQPTPSSKSPSRSTRPVSETTTLRIVKDVSSSPRDFKASVSIILSKQTTWIVQPSRGNISSTGVMGNNESSVILYDEGIVDEDKSVVFYRKVSSAFEAIFL